MSGVSSDVTGRAPPVVRHFGYFRTDPIAVNTTGPETPGTPVLPEVKINLVGVAGPVVGTVVSSRKCTASQKAAGFVRHVEIDVSGTPLEGNFRAGQSFGVIPPGVDAKGQSHKLRLYSIASPSAGEDGQGKVLATTVKRLIDERNDGGPDDHQLFLGVASNYLCDLKPGDQVKVTGPSGKRFVLPADPAAHDFVFFATGTGIAPFRGMVRDLVRGGLGGSHGGQIRLIMGSPYGTDLLYHQEMQELARANSSFRYIPTLSREVQTNGEGSMYVQERLNPGKSASTAADLLSMLASERTLVYICGIAGMELGIFQGIARALGASARDQYVRPNDEAMADIAGWTRRMLHKQIMLTKRVFLEVY
jgi:ferredoxin--NADP+ reductase